MRVMVRRPFNLEGLEFITIKQQNTVKRNAKADQQYNKGLIAVITIRILLITKESKKLLLTPTS